MVRRVVGIAILLAASGSAWAQDSWDGTKAPLLSRRNGHASAGAGGYLYVFAGYAQSGGFVHSNHRYDPVSNSWTTRATILDYDGYGYITNVGWENPAGVSHNGKIYQFCGTVRWSGISVADNMAYEYDPSTDRWSYLPAAPMLLGQASAVEVGGKIYIAGSYNSVVALIEYDPATRTYSRKTDLPGTRYAFFFGGIDDRVYVAGGDNGGMWPDSMLSDLREYNPSTNAWTLKSATMPMANAYGASASAKRRFFAIGGWADDYTTTFAYHPDSDSWETLARMPSPSYGHAAGVVTSQGATKVHVTGGGNDSMWLTTYHAVYDPPALPKPADPTDLFMRTPAGADLPHGSYTGTQVVLGGLMTDPSGLHVSMEIEVAMDGAAFTGNATHTVPFQPAGEASVTVSLSGGDWKWRVRCRNTNEEVNPGGWIDFGPSDPDFTVDDVAPGMPTPQSPSDESVKTPILDPSPVAFTWIEATDDSGLPMTYEIQVATDPSFSAIQRVGTGSGSSGSVHLTWSPAPYFWRVRAVDAYGNAGAWSASRTFMLVYDDGVNHGAGDVKCSASATSSPAGLMVLAILGGIALIRRLM